MAHDIRSLGGYIRCIIDMSNMYQKMQRKFEYMVNSDTVAEVCYALTIRVLKSKIVRFCLIEFDWSEVFCDL